MHSKQVGRSVVLIVCDAGGARYGVICRHLSSCGWRKAVSRTSFSIAYQVCLIPYEM